ncbi:MAG: peptidoglycan recognition protein family protein [Tepidanaerobacteraceae bacterium]|jgi:N-acetyl-anhydromuramyl-L-alanine amidase AmpD|nr:peptidoglycan recognition protein family protein [Tepidanaerobacteraceae bacterium]
MERLYPRFIIIHHTAGHDVPALEIDAYHARRGFGMVMAEPKRLVEEYAERGFERAEGGVVIHIGYHYLIRADGSVEKGRPDFSQGAHCSSSGMNFKSLGVALTGNFDSVDNPDGGKGHPEPTAAQMKSLRNLLDYLADIYQIPGSGIIRHRDVAGAATRCPGDRFAL